MFVFKQQSDGTQKRISTKQNHSPFLMLKSHFLGFWADWSSILWNTFGLFGWESKQSNETFETEEENKENAQTRALAKTCCQGTCCKGWRQLN